MANAPLIRNPSNGRTKELPSNQKFGVTLGQLDNVDLTGLTDGDVPRYNGTTQKFEPAPSTSLTPAEQFWQSL